jgi:hypothetical protein
MSNEKVRICLSFLAIVGNISGTTNRRECYSDGLSKEFAHTRDRFESGFERIDEAALDFLGSINSGLIPASRFKVSYYSAPQRFRRFSGTGCA